jgi:signal transduction histidine kinase
MFQTPDTFVQRVRTWNAVRGRSPPKDEGFRADPRGARLAAFSARSRLGILTELRGFVTRLAQIDRQSRSPSEPLRLLEAMINEAPVGIELFDEAGRCVMVNRAFRALFGDKPPPEYIIFDDDALAQQGILEPLALAFRGETIVTPAIWYEPRQPGGGNRVKATTTLLPLRNTAGRVTYVALMFKDVTKEAEAAERAEASELAARAVIADLERALAVRDDFLSIATHDLRSSLTVLSLQIQGLNRQAREEPTLARFRERLETTDVAVDRMSRLVSDLLDVSRMRDGRLTIQAEVVDLASLTCGVVERLRPHFECAHSAVRVRAHAPVEGFWDRLRIDQVVTNIVENAIKYGAGKPIEIQVERLHGAARITIEDHGMGVPADDCNRIFERFERTGPAQQFSGAGLGLWIAHQIVLAHRGTISVKSIPGVRTIFTITLPLKAVACLG